MFIAPLVFVSLLSGYPSANVAATTRAASQSASDFAIKWLPRKVQQWAPGIRKAAKKHGVDPELVALVVAIESGGNPGAVSRMNARGLMQVLPKTAAAIAAERGLPVPTLAELDDVERNLDFGAYLLSSLQRALFPEGIRTADDIALVGAAYNGGLQRVRRWRDGDDDLSAETHKYMKQIKKMWSSRRSDTLE